MNKAFDKWFAQYQPTNPIISKETLSALQDAFSAGWSAGYEEGYEACIDCIEADNDQVST